MKVREYLSNFNENEKVTFIIARARKDAATQYHHAEYKTTPIRAIWEWKYADVMEYHILNHKQYPIDWLGGGEWKHRVERGDLISMLVISNEDLETLYNPKQAAEMVAYIEGKIKSDI